MSANVYLRTRPFEINTSSITSGGEARFLAYRELFVIFRSLILEMGFVRVDNNGNHTAESGYYFESFIFGSAPENAQTFLTIQSVNTVNNTSYFGLKFGIGDSIPTDGSSQPTLNPNASYTFQAFSGRAGASYYCNAVGEYSILSNNSVAMLQTASKLTNYGNSSYPWFIGVIKQGKSGIYWPKTSAIYTATEGIYYLGSLPNTIQVVTEDNHPVGTSPNDKVPECLVANAMLTVNSYRTNNLDPTTQLDDILMYSGGFISPDTGAFVRDLDNSDNVYLEYKGNLYLVED